MKPLLPSLTRQGTQTPARMPVGQHRSGPIHALVLAVLVLAAVRAWGGRPRDPQPDRDAVFREELESLAARCEELGLEVQAEISRNWLPRRDPRRHYLFLPPATDATRTGADTSRLVKFWHERFTGLRGERAEQLFELAREQAKSGRESVAYRLLHEVLRDDPEHAEARRILRGENASRRGERMSRAARGRTPRAPHPLLGWSANQYARVDSDHFEIVSNANARAAREAAEYLERVHAAWRQLFYEYWSIPGRLAARFDGQDVSLAPSRTHQVVLFKDRDEYLRQLSTVEPQIGISVGYYAQNQKMSFFYAGDESVRTTWVHEATHQFFQESGDVAPMVAEQSNFWIVEGIALYMESLVDHGDYVTTGGVDADRLQYARYRLLSEGYYIPLEQLVTFGRERIQKDERISDLYSQCAGLAHFLMHPHTGDELRPVIDYLRLVYRGVAQPASLGEQLGQPYQELDQRYHQSLQVTDDDLAFVNHQIRNLCLCHTSVTDQGLQRLAGMTRLEWLDLSFTSASDVGFDTFSGATRLSQLNLERTQITDAGLDTVAGFRQLEELDLSHTQIGDEGLKKLASLTRLKVLWLTGTPISDEGLPALGSLRNLEQLDLTGTRATAGAIESLKKRLPRIK